jgi:protein phosphatase 1L
VAGRIQGVLAMARAFGNPSLKQQNYLIADPEITRTCIDDDLQFVVLASDGLWDVVSIKRVAKYLNESSQHASPSEMAEGLAMIAHQRGSTDNISVIVLSFKQRTRSKTPPNPRPSRIPIPSR